MEMRNAYRILVGDFTGEKNIRCDTAGVLLFSILHTALTIQQILQACTSICVCVCVCVCVLLQKLSHTVSF